jgi:hypothetical protein
MIDNRLLNAPEHNQGLVVMSALDPEVAALLVKLFGNESAEALEAAARINELKGVSTETFKALLSRCPARMALDLLRRPGFLSERDQADLREGAPFICYVRTSTEGLHVSEETMSKILANCTVKLRFKRTKGTLSNEGV